MMQEFIDRTGYTPSDLEYGFIEEAYYETNASKDDFCKMWLERREHGFWAMELELRKRMAAKQAQIDGLEKQLEASNADLAKALEDKNYFNKIANEYAQKNENLETELGTIKAATKASIMIESIGQEAVFTGIKSLRFVNRKDMMFVTVEQPTGWMDSYRIDGLTGFTVTTAVF